MKRNYEIDFWKFAFTIVILVFHSHKLVCAGGNLNLLTKGYLGVEFFFMVSGYMMMAGVMRNSKRGVEQSNWAFILKKFQAFFPAILFAFIPNFLVWNFYCEGLSLKETIVAFFYSVPEMFMIRYSGVRWATHFYNGPTWYLSAMLLGMFVLYPIAKKLKEKFGMYFAPIIAVAFYAWISHNKVKHNINLTHEWLQYMNAGFMRAIAGLCLGAFIYFVAEYFKNNARQLNKAGNIVFVGVEVFLTLSLYVFMRNSLVKDYADSTDFVAIIFIALLLTLVASKNYDTSKIFGSKPMQMLYKLSLPLFLNQRVALYFLEYYKPDYSFKVEFCIYLGVTFALALISIPVTSLMEKVAGKVFYAITTKKKQNNYH